MDNPYNLAPDMLTRYQQWAQAVKDKLGLDVAITEGYRDPARSNQLKASGVLAAPGGYSYHNFGQAFDYGFRKPGGGIDLYNEGAYAKAEELAKQFGLTGISTESGHIQNADYKTIADLRKTAGSTVGANTSGTTASTTASTTTSETTDPSVQAKIQEMNLLIAMQKQQQQQQVAPGITSGPAIGSLLGEIYKGGQEAGWWPAPRAQLVKNPTA
jgi:hypothetical protein